MIIFLKKVLPLDSGIATMSMSHQGRPSDVDALEKVMANLLYFCGEDLNREGLQKTPRRAAKAMTFLCSGYTQTLDEVINGALFKCENSQEVTVKDVVFYSMCEHHLLPFFGKVSVKYIPKGKVLGLSKIPRIVDMYARRFQIQERLTQQIAEAILEVTGAKSVTVEIDSQHMCSMMRGVRQQSASMYTKCVLPFTSSDD